jgi:geranylgeranyl diphosphate synthase type II
MILLAALALAEAPSRTLAVTVYPRRIPEPPLAIEAYLADCRQLVLDEVRRMLPRDTRFTGGLYGLVADYPFRGAKALRPSLCIAAARASGGGLDAVVPTAAALELFHNALLVHDDVEDGSELRRGRPTLPANHGVPISVNVGDALLALSMRPLLDNTWHLGTQRAHRLFEEFVTMAQRSAEGQAMELAWVRRRDWEITRRDYIHMVYLKTARYSFVTPLRCGRIAAGVAGDEDRLDRMAAMLGIAFQIQDDVLNLEAAPAYGKEPAGDLWEGKHTLVLVHTLSRAEPLEKQEAQRILATPRLVKTGEEVGWLLDLVRRTDGVAYAREVALAHARRARRIFESFPLPPSIHRDFFAELIDYVVERSW